MNKFHENFQLRKYNENYKEVNNKYFIIGTQKSGTTWLRDCLGEFVDIVKPEWYYVEIFRYISDHIGKFGAALPIEKREALIDSLCLATWQIVNEGVPCEKSAYPCVDGAGPLRSDVHPYAVREIRRRMPSARIVVIVRDPRSVFNSLCHYLDNMRKGWSAELDPKVFSENWAMQNLQWIADGPDSVVFYERLKSEFQLTLGGALSALEIAATSADLARAESAVYSVDKLRPRQPEIYRTGTVDEWRVRLDPRIIEVITNAAGDTMRRFGYEI